VPASPAPRPDSPARASPGRQSPGTPIKFPPQTIQREVAPQFLPKPELGPHLAYQANLCIQHLTRQPKRRNAVAQHAPRMRVRIKQHRAVATPKKVMGRSKPCRSGSNDGDALASGWRQRGRCLAWHLQPGVLIIGRKAVQVPDRERFLDITLPAALLAESRANSPQRCRQCEVVRHYLSGRAGVAGRDLRDEGRDVQPGGATRPAGPHAVACVIREQELQ
jgi:hypothetical protein